MLDTDVEIEVDEVEVAGEATETEATEADIEAADTADEDRRGAFERPPTRPTPRLQRPTRRTND